MKAGTLVTWSIQLGAKTLSATSGEIIQDMGNGFALVAINDGKQEIQRPVAYVAVSDLTVFP